MTEDIKKSGGCLCGAVRFEVILQKSEFHICHCGMCRKWGGGPFMAIHCTGTVSYAQDQGLAWYQGSDWGQRGFCTKCGTSLFWRLAQDPEAMLAVSVEALDEAEGLVLGRHIYTDVQPERYQFADNAPPE